VHVLRDGEVARFLSAIFSAAADPVVWRSSRGLLGALPPSLSRHDLFHGHLFVTGGSSGDGEVEGGGASSVVTGGSGGLGVLLHACEYPQFDPVAFPYQLGYCQRDSTLKYEPRAMDLRNIVFYEVRAYWGVSGPDIA
jgi:hypothetical protein